MFAGIDSHKDTLAVAVIDPAGRVVTVRQVANEPDGFTILAELVAGHAVGRVGIEGSTNFGWAAAMHLVTAGVSVVEVPPLMTSRERSPDPARARPTRSTRSRSPGSPPARRSCRRCGRWRGCRRSCGC